LRRRGQSQARDPRRSALFEASAPCDGCNHYEVDDVGVWCFLDCGEIYCFYELCNPPLPIDEHPF
jgi:hypothetical protein